MLMQNFKSAADLGITELQLSALQKTLVLLETGKLEHVADRDTSFGSTNTASFTGHFNMADWIGIGECGTVCCIGGTAEMLGGVGIGEYCRANPALDDLFFGSIGHPRSQPKKLSKITPEEAATALRSYLTTGDARWDLAVA